jgi:hypothetical protein
MLIHDVYKRSYFERAAELKKLYEELETLYYKDDFLFGELKIFLKDRIDKLLDAQEEILNLNAKLFKNERR